MNCDHIRPLLELYAAGALEDTERAMVEQHLEECPDCRKLGQQYQAILAHLPNALAAASNLEPPVEVKGRVIAAAMATKQRAEPSPIPESEPHRAPGDRKQNRHFFIQRRVLAVSAGVSLALAVLAFVWIFQLRVALAEERELREELETQTELIFEVVDSNQTERVFLLPTEGSPTRSDEAPPYGKVFVRNDMPYVVTMTGRLPSPPPGQVYQLWLFGAAGPELAGTLEVNDEGFGSLIYDAGRTPPTFESARVVLQTSDARSPEGVLALITPSEAED